MATPLISALRQALRTGSEEDLRRASILGTDVNLHSIRTMITGGRSEVSWEQYEAYDTVTDALLVVRLLLRAPEAVSALMASQEVRGLIADLYNAFRPDAPVHRPAISHRLQGSLNAFLHSSGQRQNYRQQQRLSLNVY